MSVEPMAAESAGAQPAGAGRELTPRRRIMAALRGEPVDRIPFVPLIDTYTLMDMDPGICGGFTPGYDLEGQRGLYRAGRALGCDVMLRHVVIASAGALAQIGPYGGFRPPVEAHMERVGNLLTRQIRTPRGTLTGTYGFTDRVGWIPHPIKHMITDYDDLRLYHYALDHSEEGPIESDFSLYRQLDADLGDDGIPTVSLSGSPLLTLVQGLCDLPNTYFLLHDHRSEVEEVMAKMHRRNMRVAKMLAGCPAEVVIQYENTSSTLHSPRDFRRYVLPCLSEAASILHAAGKLFLIHQCGKLQAFVDDMATADFDGIVDITPRPTGDLPLDEAAQRMPGKVVAGGIDPNTFVHRDPAHVRAVVGGLLERLAPYRRVLLGSADTTPRCTPAGNFAVIRELVDAMV